MYTRGPYNNREELYEKARELRKSGYGYRTIGNELGVSWETIRNWVAGLESDPKIALKLVKRLETRIENLSDAKTNSSRRKFLIRRDGHKCWSCANVQWMGKPVPLELDHIDGNRDNNEEGNLRILCPNCHAQTNTYKGKNIKYGRVAQLADATHLKCVPEMDEGSNPSSPTNNNTEE